MQRPPASEESPVFASCARCRLRQARRRRGHRRGDWHRHDDAAALRFVYVSDEARLAMPFVSLGLVPEFASSLILPQLMGNAKAAEKLLLGDPLTGADAVETGIANAVLPAAEVAPHARRVAERFNGLPPGAVRETKRLMRRARRAAASRRSASRPRCLRAPAKPRGEGSLRGLLPGASPISADSDWPRSDDDATLSEPRQRACAPRWWKCLNGEWKNEEHARQNALRQEFVRHRGLARHRPRNRKACRSRWRQHRAGGEDHGSQPQAAGNALQRSGRVEAAGGQALAVPCDIRDDTGSVAPQLRLPSNVSVASTSWSTTRARSV